MTQWTHKDRIVRYYASCDEWGRMETPEGKLEYELTFRHLKNYLHSGERILDLGGGAGRYTISLAKMGCHITLADLSANLLALAREKIHEYQVTEYVESIDHVNATELERYDDEVFDSVLALGPFYHLTYESERLKAGKEIYRILKRKGYLFVGFIPRFAGLSHLIWRAAHRPGQVTQNNYHEVFLTGRFQNQTREGFQEGYFANKEDLQALFVRIGFEYLETVAVQGIAFGRENDLYKIESTDTKLFKEIMETIESTSREDSVINFGGHCIMILRKPN